MNKYLQSLIAASALISAPVAGCYSPQGSDNNSCDTMEPVTVQRLCDVKNVPSTPLMSELQVNKYCAENAGAIVKCLQSNPNYFVGDHICYDSQTEVNAAIQDVIDLRDAVLYQAKCNDISGIENTMDQVFRNSPNPHLNSCFGITDNSKPASVECTTSIRPR
jgi:hypothetical protein